MSKATDPMRLKGKILIAMPGMGDPRFDKSVVFICDHTDEGAMGLIVNKTAPELSMGDLLDQLSINGDRFDTDQTVHFGGPVETNRGFVLHSPDYYRKGATLRVNAMASMTASLEVLQDAAEGSGPKSFFLALGYSGWGGGQLEEEIGQNGWLTAEPSDALLFSDAQDGKWTDALKGMGVDPLLLSSAAGHA
ncbi:YqgE/AlgH family protein [Pseudoruegeria sp. SHC-113]|uniref:YqgE/AlgH family protein n=1 Tax=Pseudoruegeria sp. SHC-113 TaxID=2855439 RepID=UPI0021BB2BD6|nr:YqgE/AlgH family protein [Pseudoruegeria sp. SHC-113]